MPRKTSKKKITAKKPVKELQQTHGMEEKVGHKPTTLDQVWGDSGVEKYNTLDPDTYTEWVKDQDKASLQAHAASVGLLPVDHRGELEKRLLREFHIHRSKYTKPNSHGDELPKLDKSARDVLSEGK
jgi:hypothetical protein